MGWVLCVGWVEELGEGWVCGEGCVGAVFGICLPECTREFHEDFFQAAERDAFYRFLETRWEGRRECAQVVLEPAKWAGDYQVVEGEAIS